MSTRARPCVVIAFPDAERTLRPLRPASPVNPVAPCDAEASAKVPARASNAFFALHEALLVDARNQMYS